MTLKPMYNPPHPGEVLKELYMEGLTVTKAAEYLGVTRNTMSKLINAKQDVTPEMALRLAKAFDTDAEMWMNMQNTYDLWHAEKNSKKLLRTVKRVPKSNQLHI